MLTGFWGIIQRSHNTDTTQQCGWSGQIFFFKQYLCGDDFLEQRRKTPVLKNTCGLGIANKTSSQAEKSHLSITSFYMRKQMCPICLNGFMQIIHKQESSGLPKNLVFHPLSPALHRTLSVWSLFATLIFIKLKQFRIFVLHSCKGACMLSYKVAYNKTKCNLFISISYMYIFISTCWPVNSIQYFQVIWYGAQDMTF